MNDVSRAKTAQPPGFTVVDKIPVQRGAISGIAVSPDGAQLILTHHGDDSFSVIDTGSGAVALTVVDIDEPFAVAVSDAPQSRAYVSTVSAAYDSIVAFDMTASHVVGVHPLAHSVTDLAVSPDGRHVYASRTAAHGADVAILDTNTGSEDVIGIPVAAGTTAGCVRVSPDGRRLYVAANGPAAAGLVMIDTHSNRVLNTVEIGCPIRDIALSPNGDTAYVGSCSPDFGAVLDVIDTRTDTVTGTHKVGEAAGLLTQLAVSRDGERAYLVGDASVTVLSTATHEIIGSIVVAGQPSCLTESPDGDRLYIADYTGAITVLSIAPTSGSSDAPNPDEVPTAPHQWALSNLLRLEPTPA